jgi:hypothetical protein
MVTDCFGNPLLKDDLVMVQRGDKTWLVGFIADIKEPSVLAAANQPMTMPGVVQVALMPINVMFDTKQPRLGSVIKVVKPVDFRKPKSD